MGRWTFTGPPAIHVALMNAAVSVATPFRQNSPSRSKTRQDRSDRITYVAGRDFLSVDEP